MPRRLTLPEPSQGGRGRIDKLLASVYEDVSRATIQRWLSEGRVSIGGRVCGPRELVAGGVVVEVEEGAPPPSEAAPDASVPFEVVFDDEHLLVVDKPAGVVVHPARGHVTGTLVNGLIARGSVTAELLGEEPASPVRPGIVHRIDKDTSGLLVVAKSAKVREGLKQQLARHSMERQYHALTLGVPPLGRVESLHGRHPQARLRFSSAVREGKRAVTHVLEASALAGGEVALVRCRLETGRTHQLRVHLSERLHTPLLADALYGLGRAPRSPAVAQIAARLGRQALHAATLGFLHPVTGEALRFEAPWPRDLSEALAALRALTPR